ANYEHWNNEYQRLKGLSQAKAIEKQALDEGLHRWEDAKAGLAETEAKVTAAKASREGCMAKREMAQAEVKVAQARLEVAKAEVKGVDAILQCSKVRAPFDGVIARRNVETGVFASAGAGSKTEPLFVVVRTESVRVSFEIPEGAILHARPGTPALVRF